MANLFDIINNSLSESINNAKSELYKSIDSSGMNLNKEEKNLLVENIQYLKDINERLLDAKKEIEFSNKEIDKLRDRQAKEKSQTNKNLIDDKIKKLEKQREVESKALDKIINEQKRFKTRQTKKGYSPDSVENIFNITEDPDKLNEFNKIHEVFLTQQETEADNKETLTKKSNSYNKTLGLLEKDGLSLATSGVKKLTSSLGPLGAMLFMTFKRFINLSDKLVGFNRKMGLGMSSENLLGSDLFGNNKNIGNLQSFIENQNLSFEDFLTSYEAFNKGNIIGSQNLENQKQDLLDFGRDTAKLSKFYGVSMQNLTNTASNLMFNYGASVKEINKTFDDGKHIAMGAGVNVQKFFENLEQASDMIGEYFIRGGVEGMNELALVATRLGMTTRGIMSSLDRYKTFHSQFELMNKATGYGLGETARNSRKVWALNRAGRQDEAIGIENISLARDMKNLGRFKDGQIDTGGLTMLSQMGYDKEQIASVNRLLKMQEDLGNQGITYEMLVDANKRTEKQNEIIQAYERKNQSAGEKLNTAWNTIKTSILDPLGAVLAPVFDASLNAISSFGKVFGKITELLAPGFQILGEWINVIAEKLSDFAEWLDKLLGKIGLKKDENGEVSTGASILSTAGALIASAGFMKIMKKFIPGGGLLSKGAGMISNWMGSKGITVGNIGRGIGRGGAGLLSGGKNMLGGILKSRAGRGGLAGIAGSLLGSAIGGKGGETISNISNWAGTGAMIGSVIPGLGTAVGAIIGGVGGLIYDSWSGITDVWNDESKNLFQKIGGTFEVLWTTLKDAAKALWDKTSEWLAGAKATLTNEGGWFEKAWSGEQQYEWWQDGGIINMLGYLFNPDYIEDAVKEGTKEGMLEVNKKTPQFNYQAIADERKKELEEIMKDRKKYVDEGQVSAENASKQDNDKAKQAIQVNVKGSLSMYGNELKGGMHS